MEEQCLLDSEYWAAGLGLGQAWGGIRNSPLLRGFCRVGLGRTQPKGWLEAGCLESQLHCASCVMTANCSAFLSPFSIYQMGVQ